MNGKLPSYKLEHSLRKSVQSGEQPDCSRAVRIRRAWVGMQMEAITDTSKETEFKQNTSMDGLPFDSFDQDALYQQVLGNNCESVVGFVPIPVGVAGPLKIDGQQVMVPMATTEGALVASTNRGCRAILESGGCETEVFKNGMTRAPSLRVPSAKEAARMKRWLAEDENFARVKAAFESTSNYAKLLSCEAHVAGRNVFPRFRCTTGDAMGMNMITKGVMEALEIIKVEFPQTEMLSLSGNVCCDKKPSAINWIEGRGKSVVAEVVLSESVVTNVLKCTIPALVELNVAKNLVGSAVAGSIGGNNAHAANLVAAIFLATGQDPAQVVESANCMTLFESMDGGRSLHMSVTMPAIEVGTVGGGTSLEPQKACLGLIGVAGANYDEPGKNADQLARVVAGLVLAGELSLMSALAANHLMSAHLALNRKKQD
jgi:hydroxymethylglutaryl-CoA reductase (NADPH)